MPLRCCVFLLLLLCAVARADEGQWTFEAPPRKQWKERYDFEPTDAWLAHLRLATLRVGNEWGSAAFVSADGLVATCLHTPLRWIEKAGTAQRDLVKDGFVARDLGSEIELQGLELSVLQSQEDVTARVQAAVLEKADPRAAADARRSVLGEIEAASRAKTGLVSEVVKLHHGGQFMLYRYRVFPDVRLVFAPEAKLLEVGDPRRLADPRLKFDFALLRAYEGGKPARIEHFLRWSKSGPTEGELIFQAGIPGTSQRHLSVAELAYLRDVQFPAQIRRQEREIALLQKWSEESAENARAVEDPLALANAYRANRERRLKLLADPAYDARQRAAEEAFRQRLAADPDKGKSAAASRAFDRLAEAVQTMTKLAPRYRLLEEAEAFPGEAFRFARLLLRAAQERDLPAAARMPEYLDGVRSVLERQLFPREPIYPEIETRRLAQGLQNIVDAFGTKDPLVLKVLGESTPSQRALELLTRTTLFDPAVRRRLLDGGSAALKANKDPLLELARLVDPASREVRRAMEAAEESKTQAHFEISQARLRLEGARHYPDGTNTLRLMFGPVRSFAAFEPKIVEPSDLAGLFARSDAERNAAPFALPESWLKARDRLNLQLTLNFVAAHDSLAGSSGSPMVDRSGECVGVLFGMVRWGAVGDFSHDEKTRGDIGVHSVAALEILAKIYGAQHLAEELRRGRKAD